MIAKASGVTSRSPIRILIDFKLMRSRISTDKLEGVHTNATGPFCISNFE